MPAATETTVEHVGASIASRKNGWAGAEVPGRRDDRVARAAVATLDLAGAFGVGGAAEDGVRRSGPSSDSTSLTVAIASTKEPSASWVSASPRIRQRSRISSPGWRPASGRRGRSSRPSSTAAAASPPLSRWSCAAQIRTERPCAATSESASRIAASPSRSLAASSSTRVSLCEAEQFGQHLRRAALLVGRGGADEDQGAGRLASDQERSGGLGRHRQRVLVGPGGGAAAALGGDPVGRQVEGEVDDRATFVQLLTFGFSVRMPSAYSATISRCS